MNLTFFFISLKFFFELWQDYEWYERLILLRACTDVYLYLFDDNLSKVSHFLLLGSIWRDFDEWRRKKRGVLRQPREHLYFAFSGISVKFFFSELWWDYERRRQTDNLYGMPISVLLTGGVPNFQDELSCFSGSCQFYISEILWNIKLTGPWKTTNPVWSHFSFRKAKMKNLNNELLEFLRQQRKAFTN